MAEVSEISKKSPKNRFYMIWAGMKQRCNNPGSTGYNNYGGRGINYNPAWNKFDIFLQDMAKGYSENLTLERIDNNKDYSTDNCRWVTLKEQANNRRNNRLYTLNGVTKTLEGWIELSPVKSSTVRQRLYVYGWEIERCLLEPTSSYINRSRKVQVL